VFLVGVRRVRAQSIGIALVDAYVWCARYLGAPLPFTAKDDFGVEHETRVPGIRGSSVPRADARAGMEARRVGKYLRHADR
jgi:hypothetical protein